MGGATCGFGRLATPECRVNRDRLSSLRCISTGAGAGAGTTGSGGFASIFGRFDELPELAEALRILAISAMVNGAGSSQESWADPRLVFSTTVQIFSGTNAFASELRVNKGK